MIFFPLYLAVTVDKKEYLYYLIPNLLLHAVMYHPCWAR